MIESVQRWRTPDGKLWSSLFEAERYMEQDYFINWVEQQALAIRGSGPDFPTLLDLIHDLSVEIQTHWDLSQKPINTLHKEPTP